VIARAYELAHAEKASRLGLWMLLLPAFPSSDRLCPYCRRFSITITINITFLFADSVRITLNF
jgi:hypothetical protein